ncbi:MAG TPA: ATP-dependent DNA ligase [Caulobacteraceae bacterium]|nr:ATP-dependent DNA ligase [Caulobacteraceae bacterium]
MTDGEFSALGVPLDTAPMEARLADVLPEGSGWQFEPKWDGFRCLVFRQGDAIELRAKSGKSLTRFFPDVGLRLQGAKAARFVLDGELMIQVGGEASFEALQMRLHPAESRIRRLAAETPATFVAFDLLSGPEQGSLMRAPLAERRAALEVLASGFGPGVDITPCTRERAQAQSWLDHLEARLDGVVCKRLDQPYAPGERAMIKVKRVRTADCVVGGFRYLASRKQVGSLLLGLFDEAGRLDHVGFTSTISDAERPELTGRLEALAGGPGFTGDAPGGSSRWSTERSAQWVPLRWNLVAEVRFDQVTGGRFRHGTRFVRWRPDKAPEQCRRDQLGG